MKAKSLLATALWLALWAQLGSCGAETAGARVSFATAAMGAHSSGAALSSFETATGWQVSLDKAAVIIGPVYFYSEAPVARSWSLWPLLSTARACPAHAQMDYGTVLGEVGAQYRIDLLSAEPSSTGMARGEAGTCKSAELHLHPPGAQNLAAGSSPAELASMEGNAILLAGTATQGERTLSFRAALNIPATGTMRIIQNISADVAIDDATVLPGQLVLEILVDAWFAGVDFDSLEQQDSAGVYLFDPDSQARAALLQAVRNRFSYRISWREA